jgi:hypothetical protein
MVWAILSRRGRWRGLQIAHGKALRILGFLALWVILSWFSVKSKDFIKVILYSYTVGWATPFGQRLKPHDNSAYIAYIIVLISVQDAARHHVT